MKLQSLAVVLATSLSSVAAQGMSDLPACAQDCAMGSIPEECSGINIACICGTESFIADMACCVGKSCEADDQVAALDFANGLCEGAGITNLPQTATCAGDSTSTTTDSESETATATETTSTDDSESTTTTASDPEETATTTTTAEGNDTSTESTTGTSTHSTTESANETSTPTASETPAEPEETDGAALLRGKELGLLAGIAAGVALLM